MTDETLVRVLRAASATPGSAEHPLKTKGCPPLPRFAAARASDWTAKEREHLATGCPYCARMLAIQERVAGAPAEPAAAILLTVTLPRLPDLAPWARELYQAIARELFTANPRLAGRYGGTVWGPVGGGVRRSGSAAAASEQDLHGFRAILDLDDRRTLRWDCDAEGLVRLRLQDDCGDPVPGFRVRVPDGAALEPKDGWVLLPRELAAGEAPVTLVLEVKEPGGEVR